jgi:Domain of unknown function (DUF4157)
MDALPPIDFGDRMMSLSRFRLPARGRAEDHDDVAAPRPGDEGPSNHLLGLQRTVGNQAVLRMLGDRGTVSQAVDETLRSPGEPLDESVRVPMEARFGRDFSGVRIHHDPLAAASAKAVNARAYTVGSEIVYSPGAYDPHSFEGRKLLAHELTHVAQSGGEMTGAAESLRVSESSEAAETEAHSLSDRVTVGDPVRPSVAMDGVLARDRDKNEPKPGPKGPLGKPEESKPEPEPLDMTGRLDKIAQTYREMIAAARKKGFNVAADNLQRFLDGTGGTRKLETGWLRGFSPTTAAERTNQQRFEDSLTKLAKPVVHGQHKNFEDHWDRMFTASPASELYYASGTSSIRSTGKFDLDGLENIVRISGSVNHHWFDPYDWHEGLGAYIPGFGNVSDEDALLLQKYRGAKPFMMEADWPQWVAGTYTHRSAWFDSSEYTWSGP